MSWLSKAKSALTFIFSIEARLKSVEDQINMIMHRLDRIDQRIDELYCVILQFLRNGRI